MRRVGGWAVAVVVVVGLGSAPGAARAEGPLFGKGLAAGRDLPLPFGVGLTLYQQNQGYEIDRLTIGVPGFDALPLGALEIDNRIHELNLKLDAWLFPFLNVFLLGGQLDGRTVVDFSGANLPVPLGRVSIDYDGEVWGGGAVGVVGNERLFGSLTAVWTRTSLSGDFDSDAEAFVLSPRFGLHGGRGAVWVGAMFQRAEESHAGTVSIPFVGRVPFAVRLAEQDPWNGLLGAELALDERWHLELEGGFGDRTSTVLSVSRRF